MDNEIMDCANWFIPKKIDFAASKNLTKGIDLLVVASITEAKDLGWVFYVADSQRGRCSYGSKTITIPIWATLKGKEYKQWYICHEIAHIHAGFTAKHGPIFMKWLKKLCPDDSIHYELGYKPANAARAGILSCTDF